MSGGLGPLQEAGLAGSMTFKLEAVGNTTKIELLYSVGGYYHGDMQKIAAGVDMVLGGQFLRLKNYVETGQPQVAGSK